MRPFRCVLLLLPLLLTTAGLCMAAEPPAAPEPILIDFSAAWCGYCQQAEPGIKQLEAAGYDVRRVDVDRQRDLADKWQVTSLPCFVVVKEGREVERVVGYRDCSTLRAMLERHRVPSVKIRVSGVPAPAWRYEECRGHYRATVRIECESRGHVVAKGSGALVRWGGRVVVLTARHVIKDAERIIVTTATGRRIVVKPLKVDATWDCAVLELPAGVTIEADCVAEVEYGQAALFRKDDRLESCGYGPDEKLAVNSGIFQGYRRSSATPKGPDDWAVVSGHARQGDSGGPVFNSRGRLVGVLWGTDGQTVMLVQAGRLHVLLESAVTVEGKVYQQRAFTRDGSDCYPCYKLENIPPDPYQRHPTPPKELSELPQVNPQPVEATGIMQGGQQGGDSLLPWRNKTESKLDEINSKLDAIARQPSAPSPAPICPTPPGNLPESPKPEEKERPGNALEKKLDAMLERLPIQGPLAKLADKQLESEHPMQRFFGASAAIIILTVLGTLALVLVLLLGHKIYQAAHAHKADIEAKLEKVPVIGSKLAADFERLDTFNTNRVDPKVQSVLDKLHLAAADAKAKADAALHVATTAAVAVTPVVPAAAPVAAALGAASAATHAAT